MRLPVHGSVPLLIAEGKLPILEVKILSLGLHINRQGWQTMEAKLVDARGMKCPLPTLKMMTMSHQMKPGEILEVIADRPTLEADVRKFCADTKRALLFTRAEAIANRVQVRM